MKYSDRTPNRGDREDVSVPRHEDAADEIDRGTAQSTPAQEAQDEFDEPSQNAALNDPQESQSRDRSTHHVSTP